MRINNSLRAELDCTVLRFARVGLHFVVVVVIIIIIIIHAEHVVHSAWILF